MGKRVAKEINEVVNKFYPSLENHFIQFKDLDNSYGELVNKFVVLEKAIDYATQLDSTNIKYCETGSALCTRVIQIPKQYTLADEGAAWAQGIIGAVQDNKYKKQDAVQARQKAKDRQQEIYSASLSIIHLEKKYFNKISLLNPKHDIVLAYNKHLLFNKEKNEATKKANKLEMKYGPIFAGIGLVLWLILQLTTDFLKGEEDRASLIFWSFISFIAGPWFFAVWLTKKKILK